MEYSSPPLISEGHIRMPEIADNTEPYIYIMFFPIYTYLSILIKR